MTQNNPLDSVLSKLGMNRADAADEKGTMAPSGSKPASVDHNSTEAERRIDAILSQHQASVENRVFIIDLERCREKFGDGWARAREKVQETIRGILTARLGKQDMFLHRDDDTFLVVFGVINQQEAQIKCTIIGEEILQRLFGRQPLVDLIDIKTVTVEENGDINLKPLPRIDALLEDVVQHIGNHRPSASLRTDDIAAPTKGLGLQDLRFIFRPMLAVRSNVVSTFLCIPIQVLKGRVCVSGYEVLGERAQPREYMELDLATMSKVRTELDRLGKRGEKALLCLPVHFETLADSRRRFEYVNKFLTKTTSRNGQIIFEIIGLPEGIPQARLIDLVSPLRANSRAVIARFTPEHRKFPAYRTAGLHAVGIDIYSTLKRENLLMREIDKFAQSASSNSLKSYVLGVRKVSLYTAAVTAGFAYAAGHALSSVAEAAGGAYEFQMETLYLNMLNEGPDTTPRYEDADDDIL